MTKIFYLYKITNIITTKVYIGQTTNPKNRWAAHKYASNYSKNKDQYNYHLYKSMRKYGIENFIFEIINQVETLEKINFLEKNNIKEFNSANRNFGYNISKGGNGLNTMSDETKKKLSQIHTGKKLSVKTKKKLSEINIGKKASEQTIKKMSQSMIGKNKGINNGMYGKRGARGKITIEQAKEIRQEYKLGNISMAKLGKKYNLSKRAILNIIHNKSYRE